MRKTGNNAKGFTLIEVLVSVAILTIGFLGLIGLLVVTIDKNRFAGQMSEATTLAQDKLEELRATGYVAGSATITESSLLSDGTTGVAGIYTRTTARTDNAGWNQYSVVVQWNRSGVHSVQMQSVVSQ